MMELLKLTPDHQRMEVLVRTEFGEMTLDFKPAYQPYVDVVLRGDGWAVWADCSVTKEALSRILSDMTRERFERLKALGSLPSGCQRPDFLTKLDEMDPSEFVSLRKKYDNARKTVHTLVAVGGGERYLVLPGREGNLTRTFIKYSSGRFFESKVGWEDFEAALSGGGVLRWSEVDPGWVWLEATIGLRPPKALKLLKELSEEGSGVVTATVMARKLS